MNERIKQLRNSLSLTQHAFAQKLDISRNNIAGYEAGTRNPSDAVISLICVTFNVNETWLRTGKGEMFIELSRNEQIILWVNKCLSNQSAETQRRFLKILSELPSEYWEVFADFGKRIAKEFQTNDN